MLWEFNTDNFEGIGDRENNETTAGSVSLKEVYKSSSKGVRVI